MGKDSKDQKNYAALSTTDGQKNALKMFTNKFSKVIASISLTLTE